MLKIHFFIRKSLFFSRSEQKNVTLFFLKFLLSHDAPLMLLILFLCIKLCYHSITEGVIAIHLAQAGEKKKKKKEVSYLLLSPVTSVN